MSVFVQGRRHVLAAAIVSVGYVALVASRHAPVMGLGEISAVGGALALAWVSSRLRSRTIAWATWGAAMTIAALVAWSPSTRLAGVIGAIGAGAAAMVALTRIASLGGIVRDRKRSPRIGVAAIAAAWLPAMIVVIDSLFDGHGTLGVMVDVSVAGAACVSVLAVIGFAAAARLERQLELGVVERLNAALTLGFAAGATALIAVLARAVDATAAACALLAIVSAAVCVCAELGEPVALWRAVRRATTLAGIATGLAALFGFFIVDHPARERSVIAALAFGAIVIGAELPRIARAVRGDASRRLAAAAQATNALRGRDVESALASALCALRGAAPAPLTSAPGAPTVSPQLWTLDPIRALRVDAAGYPHDDPADLPPELVVIACGEPESTLRAEALASLRVRRPDLRSLSQWMSDANMATATLIARGGEIEGILFLPSYDGIPDLTLEEASALRELADELAPLCHARAKLARSMERERLAREEADDAITRADRFEHQLARASAHHTLAAARLARPAAIGIYSARSRLAYEALERLAKTHAPAVVIARSGVDPVPFLARAHLAGARSSAPFVLVDSTISREHDLDRWRDPVSSPLALADGGVLVLQDAAALPIDIQRLVGQSLAERRAPWERADALDIVLVLTTATNPRVLADSGRLDPLLASRVGDALDSPVELPGIAERPEDIRAIVTDRLAREGLRARGAPVGIDDGAFAILVEHPFDGEDAELSAIIQKLVLGLAASANVIHEADVRAVLFGEQLVARGSSVISPKPSRRGT